MSKIFYGIYLKREEVSTALDLIRFLGEPGSIRYSHITLRGPYRRELSRARLHAINTNPSYQWTIALTEPVAFFEGVQSTVAIAVDLMSLRELLYKPDFPDGVPHITLYDGRNRAFARDLYSLVRQYVWHDELQVSTLRRIQPKRNLEHELVPLFSHFHSLYEKVVGDPRMIASAWALSLDDRLSLIGEILRGRPHRVEAPSPDQEVPAVRRAVWA